MMDRPLPALVASVAVVLLIGSWIVTRNHDDTPSRADPCNEIVYRCPLSEPTIPADCREGNPRYHVPAVIAWLPPLDETTGSAAAEFSNGEQEPLPTEPAPAAGPGPALLSPIAAEPLIAEVSLPADPETVAAPPSPTRVPSLVSPTAKSAASGSESAEAPLPAEHVALEAEQPGVTAPAEPIENVASTTTDPEPDAKPDLLVVPAYDPASRSRELEMIARQADAHTQYGFELAARGAYFSAQSEFVMALRLMAQGLDAEYRTKSHSRTLAAGLTALSEAEDFIPRGSALEADLDLATIIRRHRTPVFHDTACDSLTPLDAMQSYLTFAQEQLSFAGGGEVASSMALYALGKLHKTMAERITTNVRAARPKAVTFYQASLLVVPRNYMAANDLGVLLAQVGRYEDARAALEQSLAVESQPAGWQNLAVVYGQLGDAEAAKRASRMAASGTSGESAPSPTAPAVKWVDPTAFAQAAGPALPPSPAASATPTPPPKQAAGWLPWNTSEARK